ncbi:hypothetical protein [Agriterribacter sp.]|uniref:hypothetical protein n=1 Tax=Agriterribacter sp. TaxID=2821509 RepID=UPI002CE71B8B|nr:hypothetical protein [Agriterribacter sp.]HRP54988.1 hypothetical protein [Agriterribacter sp.]
MASVLDKELIQYFVKLNEPQKRSLLEMMKSFLTPENAIKQEAITVEQYNRELDEAMERMSKGAFTTLEELEKEMRTW